MSDSALTKVFAERLLEAERRTGLTSAELSRRSGLTKSHISQLERGRNNNPTLKSVVPLAQVLGCSIDYLCGFVDDPGIQASVIGLSDDDLSLVRTFIGVLRDNECRDSLTLVGELIKALKS